jgi:hypothetical protein
LTFPLNRSFPVIRPDLPLRAFGMPFADLRQRLIRRWIMVAPATEMDMDVAMDERIRRDIEHRMAYFVSHPAEIDNRLKELDEEWDVDRAMAAGAAGVSLLGILFGLTGRRGALLLTLVGPWLLMQHAVTGTCPAVSLIRQLKIRTRHEIENERLALKALRGDLDNVRELMGSHQTPELLWALRR